MDSGSAKNAANAVAKNNRVFYAGLAGVAVVGYLWYKRNSDVRNLGDAASRTGAATGRGLERAGEKVGGALKEEGKGFQAKQQ